MAARRFRNAPKHYPSQEDAYAAGMIERSLILDGLLHTVRRVSRGSCAGCAELRAALQKFDKMENSLYGDREGEPT